ncbi:MAG: glycosyltransferase family 2 protein [Myxococcales bacterium]|nr:glycosyltransferase family 2 protein [Myxococcales bacterium]
MGTSIGLSMIVKNEAHVVERCLRSVKPFLSYWLIVDTGSSDQTMNVIRHAMDGVPGEVVSRPWRDFAANRTEALELSREHSEYLLVIDADDTLDVPPSFVMPALTADAYMLRVAYGATTYFRAHLLKASLPWRYEGVVHEAVACDAPHQQVVLKGPVYRIGGGGARSRDPERFAKDAEVLSEALAREPANTRYAFYLAQSWRDADMPVEALAAYERRALMGGWDEEITVALLQAALLREKLGHARDLVWAAFLKAFRSCPTRAEALTELARYCRLGGDYALARVFAQSASEIPRPHDGLFLDESVYAWRALDELAVAAFYEGCHDVAAALGRRLLTEGRLPPEERARVSKNYELLPEAVRAAAEGR